MEKPKVRSESKCFGGITQFFEHPSQSTQTPMRFSVYLPPQSTTQKVPVLYWLSGLTCTDENFMTKAGAQQWAAQNALAIVAPDTSPRGAAIKGEDDNWDFGTGAGFYVNATAEPWKKHYRMYDYVTAELPEILKEHFPIDTSRESISGHSMGGHGALVLSLKQGGRYQSVSAFSPICAPSQCPWGEKAFTGYLGENRSDWAKYDAEQLVKTAKHRTALLIDQGTHDEFLKEQLKPELLQQACQSVDYPLELRMQEGYDHSYYFISSFIQDHVAFHAKALKA